MFEFSMPGWTKVADMPQSSFEVFKDRVPPEVLEWWAEYGLGYSRNGWYQTIDPVEWIDFIDAADQAKFFPGVIPLLVTCLGDVLNFEDNRYFLLNFRHYYRSPHGRELDMLMMNMNRPEGMALDYSYEMADVALQNLGPLAYGQMYGFNIVLPLGGEEKPEELHIANAKAHLAVIVEFGGPITVNSSAIKYRQWRNRS